MAFIFSCCGLRRKRVKDGRYVSAKAESGNVAFGRHDNNHYSYNISAPPPPNNAFIPFPTAPNGTRFSHELAAPTPWLDPNNNAQQIQGWQPSIPAPVFQSQEQVERQCQRDWEEWVRKESRTLPQRQAEFDRRKDVFVQITRENTFNFYGLDSRTLNATVPRRIFQHNAGGGCASEHRAVRRVAYMKTAYLAGLHKSFPEDQLYDRGRKLFNERHSNRLAAARQRGESFPPISVFERNNNTEYPGTAKSAQYCKIPTANDPFIHDKVD